MSIITHHQLLILLILLLLLLLLLLLRLIFEKEIESDWPVTVMLSTGEAVDCDFIVSATGVVPNTQIPGLEVW